MTGNQMNNELGLNAESARYRRTGDWYHPLGKFPGVLFDINGYVIFQTEEEYRACAEIAFGQDINIRNGISSIPSYISFTAEQSFKIKKLDNDYESALRIQREYSTYHRNPKKCSNNQKFI